MAKQITPCRCIRDWCSTLKFGSRTSSLRLRSSLILFFSLEHIRFVKFNIKSSHSFRDLFFFYFVCFMCEKKNFQTRLLLLLVPETNIVYNNIILNCYGGFHFGLTYYTLIKILLGTLRFLPTCHNYDDLLYSRFYKQCFY